MAGLGGRPYEIEHTTDKPRSIDYFDTAYGEHRDFDATAPGGRTCLCRYGYSYPNLVVHQITKERNEMMRDHIEHRYHIRYLNQRVDYAYGRVATLKAEAVQARQEIESLKKRLAEAEEQLRQTAAREETVDSEETWPQPEAWEIDAWAGSGGEESEVYSDPEEDEPAEDPSEGYLGSPSED